MNKLKFYPLLLNFSPLLILLFFVIPLAVFINPQLVPRFMGETSHISEYGYLDLEHYINIALGMKQESYRTAFFPLWPFLIKQIHNVIHLDMYKVAIFTSSFIGIITFLLSKYVINCISIKQSTSLISWALYVLNPMTVFYFVGYTESIFALETWILIIFLWKLLNTSNRKSYGYILSCLFIFIASVLLSLTRPILIQMIFAISASILSIIYSNDLLHKRNFRKYMDISFLIIVGTVIGYVIYGTSLTNSGFRFFEPFFAQQLWEKSFGFRPVYFFTSRSSLIDLWGLYFPFILYSLSLAKSSFLAGRLQSLSLIFSRSLPLTLLYPPIGIIWGLTTSKAVEQFDHNQVIESKQFDSDLAALEFIFLFTIFFAISHSLICFLTQPNYLRSLGRYIFGQPYFYIALAIFLNSSGKNLIRRNLTLFSITSLISLLYLIKNFVEFGSARLSP